MRVLFIHQNMPGQYKHLARALAAKPGNDVAFITKPKKPEVPGVTKVIYKLAREPAKETHRYLQNAEAGVLHGQAAARAAYKLKEKGFTPDIICAHPGWGEALFLKDVYPNVPLLNYCEFYYQPRGSDLDFDPKRKIQLDDYARIRPKNTVQLLSVASCDWGISPTRWQKEQFPREYLNKISIIHDGVDAEVARPDPEATARLPNGIVLTPKDEVVTYVARNLEPYRGFPTFMHAVEEVCRRRPNTHFLIVGGDDVSYGARLPDGRTHREKILSEVTIDPARVHFTGRIPYDKFLRVLQVSSVHVYLTYPFVLSWSMLEAMAAECLVVGSDTAPVREVIDDGKNGLLVDFFSPKAIADRIDEVLDHKDRMQEIRRRAHRVVLQRYELKACLAKQVRLLETLAAGRRPDAGRKPSSGRPRRRRK